MTKLPLLCSSVPSDDPWLRHQIETFSALLAVCSGNSPVTGEFPTQKPVTQSFDVFFDLRLNKRLNKQSWGWWFETSSLPLWRHSNAMWNLFRYYFNEGVPDNFINRVMFYLSKCARHEGYDSILIATNSIANTTLSTWHVTSHLIHFKCSRDFKPN